MIVLVVVVVVVIVVMTIVIVTFTDTATFTFTFTDTVIVTFTVTFTFTFAFTVTAIQRKPKIGTFPPNQPPRIRAIPQHEPDLLFRPAQYKELGIERAEGDVVRGRLEEALEEALLGAFHGGCEEAFFRHQSINQSINGWMATAVAVVVNSSQH